MSKSHNSNEQPDLPFRLTGSQAKTAYALRHNAENLCREATLARTGFLTLTVGDETAEGFRQVWDAKEASRRINCLRTGLLAEMFERAVVVTERHASGAIHFHLLVELRGKMDIRAGFDFAAVKRGDYSSVSPHLLALWAMLRERLPAYGFGRAELTPIRTCGEAVSSYVAKYVEKNLFNRLVEDRHKKLVRYHGFDGSQLKPNQFSWANARATAWRCKTRALAALVGISAREQMPVAFGPRWAFRVTRVMKAVDDRPRKTFDWSWPEMQAARLLMLQAATRKGYLRSLMSMVPDSTPTGAILPGATKGGVKEGYAARHASPNAGLFGFHVRSNADFRHAVTIEAGMNRYKGNLP